MKTENDMGTLSAKSNEQKVFNFGLPLELYRELDEISKYLNMTKANLAREAIKKFIGKAKKNIIQHELEEAYKANYDLLEREAEDWDYVSIEGMNDL